MVVLIRERTRPAGFPADSILRIRDTIDPTTAD
jgi:hypothetical protein